MAQPERHEERECLACRQHVTATPHRAPTGWIADRCDGRIGGVMKHRPLLKFRED